MSLELSGTLDLWNILVGSVFGSFWLTVIGILFVLGIILMLGRISVYTTMWYGIFFLLIMSMGYGFVMGSVIISIAILVGSFMSYKGYFDRAGQ